MLIKLQTHGRRLWNQSKSHLIPLISLALLVVLILKVFLVDRLVVSDDYQLHAARVANYYLALKQGQFPPRLAPNLNQGYGYPVFLFTYHLPYLLTTILTVISQLSIQLSLNLIVIIFTLIGIVGAYVLAINHRLKPWQAMITATSYSLAPYMLINVFLRGALGEIAFLSLVPWVLTIGRRWAGLKLTVAQPTPPALLVISSLILSTCLLLTHPPAVVIFGPMIIGYVLIVRSQQQLTFNNRWLRHSLITGCLALTLVSWFWLPAVVEKRYISYQQNSDIKAVSHQVLPWSQLLTPALMSDSIFVIEKLLAVGYGQWLVAVTGLGVLYFQFRTRRQRLTNSQLLLIYELIWFGVGVMMISPLSKWLWTHLTWLEYFQFPWRLLWIPVLASSLISIDIWQRINRHQLNSRWQWPLIVTLVFLPASIANYTRVRGFQSWSDYELREYFQSAATYNEHLPIWANHYSAHELEERAALRTAGQKFYVNDQTQPAPTAQIEIIDWTGTTKTYRITTSDQVEVIERTHFFPGWEVKVNHSPIAFSYQDEEFPGFITYTLPQGEHLIQTKFTNHTPARMFGDSLFILGIVASGFYLVMNNGKIKP